MRKIRILGTAVITRQLMGKKDVTFKIIQNAQAVETLDSLMTTQQFR